MWNRLESGRRTAYEDKEHCNTYVIPITYADRNPDGSAREQHLEIGEQLCTYCEEKIKGWGSPKLDKVKNTKWEDIEFPAVWERIIKMPDGSCKKVILYNMGLSTLLKEGEKLLRKIESTFRIFYEYRGEVALWCHPHPLIPATIDSMRTELKQQYSDIVAKNKNDAWGIYDDTADLHRAIAASDAYYGDGSSVTRLFQAAGKAVMIEKM